MIEKRNIEIIYDLTTIALDRFGEVPTEFRETMKVVLEQDLVNPKSIDTIINMIEEAVRNERDKYDVNYIIGYLGYEVE